MEVRGQPQCLSLFFQTGSLTGTLRLVDKARLAGQQASAICPSLRPECWDYKRVCSLTYLYMFECLTTEAGPPAPAFVWNGGSGAEWRSSPYKASTSPTQLSSPAQDLNIF